MKDILKAVAKNIFIAFKAGAGICFCAAAVKEWLGEM